MAIEIKNKFIGGLNLDDFNFLVPPISYVDALNITINSDSANNDNIISNIVGNQPSGFTLPTGTNKCIGKFPFELRNLIYYFNYNSNGFHGVYEYDVTAKITTKIFLNLTDSANVDILGFTISGKINSVNIFARDEGDLLFFLDSLGRPTQMDITQFKLGTYIPVTRVILDKCKKPPLFPITSVYDADTAVRSNYTRGQLFRFKYRWIYDDFEKSVFGPISKVPLPYNILSDTFTSVITNNNVIRLSFNSGDKNVSSVELAMSFSDKTNNWSDFQSIAVLKKTSFELSAITQTIAAGTSSETIITFAGIIPLGTIINVYLNGDTLIGTYTTVVGETLSSLTYNLLLSVVSIGLTTGQSAIGNQLFVYYNSSSTFEKVQITEGIVDVDTINNIDFPYNFYNDSSYPSIDIDESIQLFDYVPDSAVSQALVNGTNLAYGGITEGYNKDTIQNSTISVGVIPASSGAPIGSLTAVITENTYHSRSGGFPDFQRMKYTFSGSPVAGTVIVVNVRRKGDTSNRVASTYTVLAGDTSDIVSRRIASNNTETNINAYYTGASAVNFDIFIPYYITLPSNFFYSEVVITPPTGTSANNSTPTFPWSSSRILARQYFDIHGKTNGVLYTDKVVFPAYAENGSYVPLLPYIDYKINDTPPIWAVSFGFLLNKDNTTFLFWRTNALLIPSEAYLYFEVTGLLANAIKYPSTANVLSYSFKNGDRMRLIRDDTSNFVFDDTYDAEVIGLLVDPFVDGVVTTPAGRQFIKINKLAPFLTGLDATHEYVINIYSPTQNSSSTTNQVYYEIGRNYPILDAGLPTRRHGGQITDQIVGSVPAEYTFYAGDVYFRSRTIWLDQTNISGYATFNVIDKNFVDIYYSAVSSIDGRSSIIDINAKQQYFRAMIRFGEAYESDTNINRLGRFYPLNYIEGNYTFGAITRMRSRDNFIKIFQQFKIGVSPIYNQLSKDSTGNQILIVTDKLLNPIQYRIGEFGLSAPESLASWHFADYGCDINKGVVWRDSNDGTEPISELYKIDSWALYELPLRKGDIKIYGGFDAKSQKYIISLEAYIQPVCVAAAIPSFSFTDAVANVLFTQSITLIGSQPFSVAVTAIPAWMSYVLNMAILTFSGTPNVGQEGTAIPISFSISNACGTESVNKTINVDAPSCVPVTLSTTTLPDFALDAPYSFALEIAGTEPFTLVVTTVPAWLTIAIVGGDTLSFTGNPVDADAGTHDVVYTLTNECGSFPVTTTISSEEVIIGGDFIIHNASVNATITNVTPRGDYSYNPAIQDFPMGKMKTINGTHGGFTDSLAVSIISPDSCVITLYLNAVSQQVLNPTNSGTYTFSSLAFASTDNIKIEVTTT